MNKQKQDPHAGMGGAYEIVNGERVLVHRTEDRHLQLANAEGGAERVADFKTATFGVAPPPLEVGGRDKAAVAATKR